MRHQGGPALANSGGMSLPHRLAAILLCALPLGCAQPDTFSGNDDKSDQQQCTAVDYDYLPDNGGSGQTTERIRSLNDYAQVKLASRQCDIDNTLDRRGELVPGAPNISDVYRVEVGSEEQCLNGGFLFADYDLDTDERYEDMKQQVDMAVDFLARIHEDTGGVPTVLFDRITICPKEFWGEEMALAGQTLYVNAAFSQFGGISTLDGRELRADLWSPGEHLNQFAAGDALKLVWPLLDPAGTVRSALRHGVAERVGDLVGKLADTLNGEDREGGEDTGGNAHLLKSALMISAIKEHVLDAPGPEGEPSLKDKALGLMASATDKQIGCVAEEWKAYVEEPQSWTSASEAGVAALYKEAARNSLDVKVKQSGLIVVGNTHFVNVNLDIFLSSGYEQLERYVEVVEVEQNIEWEQTGLIVVYTVDDIDISVNVSVNKTLQSAGFVESAGACGLEI